MIKVYTKKHKKPLEFNWNKNLRKYIWRDKRKNLYALFLDQDFCQPLWIGRLYNDVWLGWERELGAKKVEFLFGEYIFKN